MSDDMVENVPFHKSHSFGVLFNKAIRILNDKRDVYYLYGIWIALDCVDRDVRIQIYTKKNYIHVCFVFGQSYRF